MSATTLQVPLCEVKSITLDRTVKLPAIPNHRCTYLPIIRPINFLQQPVVAPCFSTMTIDIKIIRTLVIMSVTKHD